MRVLGLMSGTSADGVDLVLAEFRGRPPRVVHRVLEHLEVPYPEGLRKRVLVAMRGADTREIALLHHDLGRFYLEAALPFRGKAELVALSGQTVWHEPPRATFQLGEPSHLALGLGVPVVHGFRAVDLAAGGQGAPLVAYPDLLLFGEAGKRVAVHNLGGISNLTFFQDQDPQTLLAFDTGPGVCLFDEAVEALGLSLEEAVALAEGALPEEEALRLWLAHPYFHLPPPKTTGREIWRLTALKPLPQDPATLLRTLLELTARSVLLAYRRFVGDVDRVLLAGGGARNRVLVGLLAQHLPVAVMENPKVREPLAFALLGYLHRIGEVNVLGRATGSRDLRAGQVVEP
ncbi:anhydro-N-acetylmuramic acid kinase [Thermus tengchongensis]|uniref:Anhydro-N-acetylmuramic acid kinase n=1 Tax=Thermus tengchongensis TaxID=1214928 RepID=A0ABY2K6M3_9DEIN|nr:anhydro-N-acetylmuramic acid kinase [Thermus tengchongensis]TFU15335.1 anhydro-N-acetylmuramic acid kinase [Thermus tengchongensis]